MKGFFFHREIYLCCFFLLYTLPCIGQEPITVFEKAWKKGHTHLLEEEFDSLKQSVTELERLTSDKQSVQYGKTTYLLGEYWYAKKKWAKSKIYLDRAIPLLEKDTSEALILAEAYLVKAFVAEALKEGEQELLFYQKALALKEQLHGTIHPRVASIYFNIGQTYQTRQELAKSDSSFQIGIKILQTIDTVETEELADYYEELGFNHSVKDDFKSATKYLEKALAIKERMLEKNNSSLVYSYDYLGAIYRNAEYFGEAINYHQKALTILKEQEERDVFQEAMLNYDIGKSYFKLKAYPKAFTYFDKAAKIDPSIKYILYSTYRLQGEVASENGDNAKANDYFKRSRNIANQLKNNEAYLLEINKSIAQHQLKIKHYEAAMENAQTMLDQGSTTYKKYTNHFFDIHLLLGKCHLALKDFTKAQSFFSEANQVNGGTISKDFVNLKQLKNKVTLNLEYANLYKERYNEAYDWSILLKSDSLLTETIQLVDYIITTYQEKSTKENFIEEYHKVFKKSIEVKYLLANITKKESYLRTAFELAEKSKNLILLETLNKVDALESIAISDSIIKKEQALRIDITYLENRRFEEQQKNNINESAINAFNEQIFDLKEQYQALLTYIETTYPEYFRLKFRPTSISIENIQQERLTEKETIVEYFLGDDLIYVFLIKKNDFKVLTLPEEEALSTKIDQFRESIYNYRPANTAAQKALNKTLMETTHRLGFELYSSFFLPFQKELTQKVIIIADGVLGYLPFDALITKSPNEKKPLNHTDYLMDDYIVSYAHSINWLNGLYKRDKVDFPNNFIGIAPLFKGTDENAIADFRLGLGPLKYNQEEVINIKNSIGGKIVTGLTATRQAFLDYLKQGQILHLATHGKSDDQQGDYSYLAFAEPSDERDNQLLYVKDLFNLRIPAELVVLSACETGLGEIKRGEGIVGIGKGFSYAGAKSMVSTLWRVSDNSTANFMPIFYKNLKARQPKDQALWNAKKEFIRKYRTTGHPFFWSGYVAYGNMEPIIFQHYNWSYAAVARNSLILGAMLCLTFFFTKRQKVI